MTRPTGDLLRSATFQEDSPFLQDRAGSGFILRNVEIKRLRSTNAPVYLFEVLDPDNNRLGVASLVLEPSMDAVRDFGHVCVTLSENRSNHAFLACVGKSVFDAAYNLGLKTLRVVIPADHAASVGACELLQPRAAAEHLDRNGNSLLAYLYQQA